MHHFWVGLWPVGMSRSIPTGPQLSKQAAPFFSHFLPIWWVLAPQGNFAHYRDKYFTWLQQSLEKLFILIKRKDCGDIRKRNSHGDLILKELRMGPPADDLSCSKGSRHSGPHLWTLPKGTSYSRCLDSVTSRASLRSFEDTFQSFIFRFCSRHSQTSILGSQG